MGANLPDKGDGTGTARKKFVKELQEDVVKQVKKLSFPGRKAPSTWKPLNVPKTGK